MASGSSMATCHWVHDVFLSFGEDTRDTFAGYLCSNLQRKGIMTFLGEETSGGEQADPEACNAMKGSRIFIVIFSRNYVRSSQCLDELVRIVECSESMGQTIIPVFYRVKPLELRERKGEVGVAIEELEERCKDNMGKVQKWRNALLQASGIFGWKFDIGYESEIIERIAQDISRRVGRTYLYAAEPPTGMDSILNELKSILRNGSPETCVIGLYGICRNAKTNIARACYNSVFESFEGSSFLANVSATSKQCNGLTGLQEMLLNEILGSNDYLEVVNVARGINLIMERLRNKRVLIVLDDVDHFNQLEALAGSIDWFGSGSRMIITARDEQLLVVQGVDRRYRIDEPSDYGDALQHLGFPHDEIREIHRANFDALGPHEKAIFLDIACFFRGENRDHVVQTLSNCNLYPDIGIPVLVNKCLIHIKGNELHINDSLQHMGRDIVCQESPNPGKRSRLWFHEDVLQVLEENSGTDAIEGLLIDLPRDNERVLNAKALANMKRLRLLIVNNACFSGGPESLPNELRWLEWSNYPSRSLPSYFRPKKLTVLKLRSGSITHLWDGVKMCLNLAILELIKCESLCEVPDVSAVPNLVKLIVNHCTSLVSVHKSVGFLEKLTVLDLRGCSNLRSVPAELRLLSLETLILSGCSNLEKLPDILAGMGPVKIMDLSYTAIQELPSSIENLTWLSYLKLSFCRNLKALPSNIYSLPKIKELHLKGCMRLQEFPMYKNSLVDSKTGFLMLESLDASSCCISNLDFLKALNCFIKLQNLDLSRNNMVTLPSCISKFSELKVLHLEDCKHLREIPELPPNLTYVNAKGCESLERLHTRILRSNTKLKLDFSNCHRLRQTQVAEKLLYEASFGDSEFQVIVTGHDIPDGFPYRSRDHSMSFEVQSCVREKLVGLIVSTAFCLNDKVPFILKCNVSINGETVVSLASDIGDSLKLDHVWLGYFPLHQRLEEIQDGCHKVVISFTFLEGDGKESAVVKLKGSGMRFLGKPDKDELNGSTDIHLLFPESCRFLRGSAASTSFDSMEVVRFTNTKCPDDKEIRDAAEDSTLNSRRLLPEKEKKRPSYMRRRKRRIGLHPG